MKIKGVIEDKRLKRRFSPFIKPLIQAIKAIDQLPEFLNSIKTLKPTTSKMNPPNPPYNSRIRLMRECSWTDSDTSSNESGDSAQSRYGLNPAPIPELRRRRSHVYSFSSEQLEERRNEGYECLVGFLLDYRRFSTDFVQRYINREWELRGNATVIGREGNKFLIHYDREIDRRVGVIANPWAIGGAIIVLQRWNPNVQLSQARLLRVNLWLQIWDLPFEYQQPFIARTMSQSAELVLQVDWENRRPRNIRFMRIIVSVDLSAPLVPGCTLERDDGPLEVREMEEEAAQQPQGEIQGQSQEPETTSNTPQNQEVATPRIEEDIQGGEEVERIEGYIVEQQQQHTDNEREEETRRERQRLQQNQLEAMVPGARSQHGVAMSAERIIEMTREMTDAVPQAAASVDQLAHLTQRHPNQPSSFLEEFNGDYQYPQSPMEDPMKEFDNSLDRSTNLLSGLQMRDLNNPHTQSCQPRWINLPEGGAAFTNAKLVREEEHKAESSAMGERRNQGGEFHRPKDMRFHLELIVNGEQQENLRFIGNSYYNLQVQDYTNNLHSIPETGEDQPDAYKEAEVDIKSPAYRCVVNDEDMVSVFLKDSPTDEGAQRQNKELEESEKKKGKKIREEEATSDTDSEDGRRIRQKLQNLAMEEELEERQRQRSSIVIREVQEQELGLRQAVPQQPPKNQ
ncbi:hypothetical protein COLO4_28482 [Corchorus olitorius]|uniref:DUF4283 domain-containing protein n=1 Tax=Corchorus olitorius TaxID=93759 RepID=A0A1R3HK92_9ROSI|nr:hypothetical protein COLO4_28482 [Corchorus olitorius]